MLWHSSIVVLMLGLFLGCALPSASATEICPSRHNTSLRFTDVFDGSTDELATLVPDKATKHTGYWQLGYIYDAGRFVTIRCKYTDGHVLDVKLPSRIEKCDYTIDAKKTLKLNCK
jgi:hypothetical protein